MKLTKITLTSEQAEELLERDYFITRNDNFGPSDLINIIVIKNASESQSILYRVIKVDTSPEGLKDGYCILWWEEVIILRRERVHIKNMRVRE